MLIALKNKITHNFSNRPIIDSFRWSSADKHESHNPLYVKIFSANLAKTEDQIGMSGTYLTSEMDGNTPLWVTRKRTDHSYDIYINNAKIIKGQSDFRARNDKGKDQVRIASVAP